jgi:hypothetical protein
MKTRTKMDFLWIIIIGCFSVLILSTSGMDSLIKEPLNIE